MWFVKFCRLNANRLTLLGIILTIMCLLVNSMELCRFTVFVIVIICLSLGIQERKVVNPYLLFMLTPITLLMYVDLGGHYFVNLEVQTWILSIINMLAFVIGLKYTSEVKNYGCFYGVVQGKKIYNHMFFLYFLIWMAPFSGPFRYVLPLLSPVVIVLAFSTRKKKIIILYTSLIMINILVGSSSKTTILTTLFAYLISYEKYYVTTVKQKMRIVLLSLLGVIFMIFAFSFANKDRGNYDAESGLEYYSRDGLNWNLDSRLFLPYMYLETPWINLQYVIKFQDTRTYGLWALKPILGYVGLKDDVGYELIPYSSFNTFTFISCHFKDFGYYGSVLLSFFLGFFVKKIYSLSNKSPSPFVLGSYTLVAQATFEMFFSNHFFMQSYPFTICIMIFLYQRAFTNPKTIKI